MNNKKISRLKLLLLVIVILVLLVIIYIFNRNSLLENTLGIEKSAEEITEPISYQVYHSLNGTVKMLVTFYEPENGIDTIYYPDNSNIINAHNKKKVSMDYEMNHVKNNTETVLFKFKNSLEQEFSKEISINDEMLNNIISAEINKEDTFANLKINNYSDIPDTKSFKVKVNNLNDDFVTYNTGQKYHLGRIKNIIDDDGNLNMTIRQTDEAGNIIEVEKTMPVEDNIISNESILKCVEDSSLKSGYYLFNINCDGNTEKYYAHIYVYYTDQTWDDMTFGNGDDVANASADASNMVVVKVNGNLTINENATITAYSTQYGGPKGMLIYCTKELTNNGTISMTAKGARAEGEDVYLWKNADGTPPEKVPAIGAVGGVSVKAGWNTKLSGNSGSNGTGRKTGGGGSGGAIAGDEDPKDITSGAGGSGTSYSGGSGGGGANANLIKKRTLVAYPGSLIGGSGGSGNTEKDYRSWATRHAGGGAGNPRWLWKYCMEIRECQCRF